MSAASRGGGNPFNSDQTERQMRFMTLVTSRENALAGPPPQALIDAITKLALDAMKAGYLRDTGGLFPTADAVSVRASGGRLSVIDGPFAEAKEVVGGYAIFELPSKEEAVRQAKLFMDLHVKHWPEWEGTCVVRQMYPADLDPAEGKATPTAKDLGCAA